MSFRIQEQLRRIKRNQEKDKERAGGSDPVLFEPMMIPKKKKKKDAPPLKVKANVLIRMLGAVLEKCHVLANWSLSTKLLSFLQF
jgi:hypothetical protein